MTFSSTKARPRGRPANAPTSEIGKRVRQRMDALGIRTQAELARRLGWQPFQVSRIMAGTKPWARNLEALARALECSPHWLLTGKGSEIPGRMPRLGQQITEAMAMLGISTVRDLSRISQIPQSEIEESIRTGAARPSTLEALARALDLSESSLAVHAYGRPPRAVPLLGRVAAGTPILAEQNLDGWIDAAEIVDAGGETFALRVRGDSMIEAGLQDGDIVFVRHQPAVPPGDMAVVIIGDEATVKFLHEEPGHWVLKPANSAMKALRVPKTENVRIAGRVTGWIHRR